jgi:hypothetical protein
MISAVILIERVAISRGHETHETRSRSRNSHSFPSSAFSPCQKYDSELYRHTPFRQAVDQINIDRDALLLEQRHRLPLALQAHLRVIIRL